MEILKLKNSIMIGGNLFDAGTQVTPLERFGGLVKVSAKFHAWGRTTETTGWVAPHCIVRADGKKFQY